ncbi:MAG: hypothetical protein QOD41_1421, partial [Cryptosporangiaceae bacterium]|nr:hypothetical protein [Cryptosporangiaceae bacterium]
MFRFNNPDALLTLLLVAGAYCVVRAAEKGSTRWLLLAGSAIGFGFLAKMLQALLVVPAFGLVYLVAAPVSVRRRIAQLAGALVAMVASAGWWVAIVDLWPASSRPYIGGSTNNTALDLALGYNGLGRLFGGTGNGGGGGGAGGAGNSGFGGATGITRMFGDSFGTQVSWLLPAALIGLLGGLWLTRRAPRTDRTRAALMLWGGWVVVTALVFSYMKGTIHPYYSIALAPGIAGLLAVSAAALWRARATVIARGTLALMTATSGAWAYVLLGRTPSWHPELRFGAVVLAALATAALLIPAQRIAKAAAVVATVAVLAGAAAPAAYALNTAATAHTGSIPTAGPAVAGGGMFGGQRGGGGQPPAGMGQPPSGTGQAPSGGFGPQGTTGSAPAAGGGVGRADGGDAVSSAVTTLLKATSTRWAAAAIGSQSAAPLQLASGRPVMSIGGFNGGDPAPTLAQFQAYVAAGQVRYFVGGGNGGFGGGRGGDGSGSASQISSWVQSTFTSVTVGGQTVYDLTQRA